MSNKSKLKPVVLAVGAAFATTLATAPIVNAAENPFAMTQLEAGFKLADNHQGKEGQCGANNKAKEANCGANKAKEEKAKEAQCGANKAKEQKKAKEGKCGEGKCGGAKK